MSKIIGHTFLAKMGKKRLRPGGIKATKWLFKQVILNNKNILEVACNMGTTSFELAKKYKVKITAIDRDEMIIKKAQEKLGKSNLTKKLNFDVGNALNLKYEKDQFDIVLNEAMLTMLSDENKKIALKQYFNVLKSRGTLLTHDVCLLTQDETLQNQIIKELSHAINLDVSPKSIVDWKSFFYEAGFKKVIIKTGKMSLLNPIGMIRDEGLINTLKIISRTLKKENKQQFKTMIRFFKKYKKYIGFIAIVSKKE